MSKPPHYHLRIVRNRIATVRAGDPQLHNESRPVHEPRDGSMQLELKRNV